MSAFQFKRLVILSRTERAATQIDFHPVTTVITGGNHLGKSSIIKTLLWTLGAESKFSDAWKKVKPTSLLYFSLDGKGGAILRDGSSFCIFDEDDKPVEIFKRITTELGPYLAERFRFGLKLSDNQGNVATPPPSFYFLPFYFDQDISWIKPWESFQGLQQMKNWKKDVADYHVGIKPNKYYDLGGKQAELIQKRNITAKELETFHKIREDILGNIEEISVTIDLNDFQEEITEIIVECEKIQKTADAIRTNLVEFHNDRISIETQIQMVSSSLNELGKDYDFLKNSADHIDCPLCHATYSSDFSETFEVALDSDRCEELLIRLREDLTSIKRKIGSESANHAKHEEEIAKIKALLERRKKEVSLDDLIERESKKRVTLTLKARNEMLIKKLVELETELKSIEVKLKQLVSKERKAEILKYYRQTLRSHHITLGLPIPEEDKVKTVYSMPSEGGSYQPRALLAYGFAILKTINQKFAGVDAPVFAPIIIDSPIQQEQDEEHHVQILEFIKSNRPEGGQMIIGVVDAKGVELGDKTITLSNEQRSVLSSDDYALLSKEIEPFWISMNSKDAESL